jgi:integrase
MNEMANARYQHGHIKKVPRSGGAFAWKYYYRQTDPDGVRRLKSQTFSSIEYPTETSVWKAVEGQLASLNENTLAGKVAYTFGQLIDKYLKEELPALAWSTQGTNRSLLELYIRPKWTDTRLTDIKALRVKNWIDKELTFGAASKARARNLISRLLDLAMLWELIPTVERNPMQLVKVKGASKRQKPLTILTIEQFKKLVGALSSPFNLIIFVTGCLGLRISETLALKWSDIDPQDSNITIQRVFTHSRMKEFPKTDASWRILPLQSPIMQRLIDWKEVCKPESDDSFIFPGAKGTPRSDSTMMTDHIKPTAEELGIRNFGYHSLRHSYKTWLDGKGVSLTEQKDLMGHADIDTTANKYGKTLTDEMRAANKRVVDLLT